MSAEVTEDEISEKCLKPNIPSDSDIAEDEDIMAYLTGMISELEGPYDLETVQESVGPFLESYGCEDDVNSRICESIVDLYNSKNGGGDGNDNDDAENVINTEQTQLLQSGVSMISGLNIQTDAELDAQSFLWGTDQGVKANHNVVREAYDNKDSAKERRVARKELERSRREYEAAAKRAEEESDRAGVVTTMVLPDYESTTERSRDIQVRNISLALDNGRSILDSGELRLAYGRRYGLVGKNGVGKTTLFKAIAFMQIEGFPRHHRVLHVRQEVAHVPKGSPASSDGDRNCFALTRETDEMSILQSVIKSDVERTSLITEERKI